MRGVVCVACIILTCAGFRSNERFVIRMPPKSKNSARGGMDGPTPQRHMHTTHATELHRNITSSRRQFVSTRSLTTTEARREAERFILHSRAEAAIVATHGESLCEGGCFREVGIRDVHHRADKPSHATTSVASRVRTPGTPSEPSGIKWRLKLHKNNDGDNYYVLTNEYSPDTGGDDAYDNGDIIENGNHDLLLFLGGSLTIVCALLWTYQLLMHVKYARWMQLQKCYLRLALLSPVYSICAWMSIWRAQYAGYFEVVRSVYEGYALLVFALMIVICAGGWPRAIKTMEADPEPARLRVCPCACSAVWTYGSKPFALGFYLFLVAQFFFAKPVVSGFQKLYEDRHDVIQEDKYLKSVVVASVTLALIGIVNMYTHLNVACHALRLPLKISVLKGAVFFTVWQEVVFHVLISEGVIESVYCRVTCPKGGQNGGLGAAQCPRVCRPDVPRSGVRSVAMLVVLEMVVLSVVNLWVFSHTDAALDVHRPGRQDPGTPRPVAPGEPALGDMDKGSGRGSDPKYTTWDPHESTCHLLGRVARALIKVLNFSDFSSDDEPYFVQNGGGLFVESAGHPQESSAKPF